MKQFKDIGQKELMTAMKHFVDELGISGSILGVYDIYQAIFKEQQKARNYKDPFDNEEFEPETPFGDDPMDDR